jgi:hypothetical protein
MESGCKSRFFYKQVAPKGVKNRSVNSFQARWSPLSIEKVSKNTMRLRRCLLNEQSL